MLDVAEKVTVEKDKVQQDPAPRTLPSQKRKTKVTAGEIDPANPTPSKNSCDKADEIDESKAGFVGGMLTSILLTVIAVVSHLTQITSTWIFTTILVGFIGGVLVYTWPALVRAPHPGPTRVSMGIVWAGGLTLSVVSADRLAYLVPLAVFLSCVAEMFRQDDRKNLVESLSMTFVGCLAVIGTVVWIPPLYLFSHGPVLVTTCCALMIGTLGRYNAGQPMHRKNTYPMWHPIMRSMLSAGIGAVAGCYTLVSSEFDGLAIVHIALWVVLVAVVFGLVAGYADYTCRHVTHWKASLALGVLPVSALGFIFYGLLPLALAGVPFLS